jgi:hypothetical protein
MSELELGKKPLTSAWKEISEQRIYFKNLTHYWDPTKNNDFNQDVVKRGPGDWFFKNHNLSHHHPSIYAYMSAYHFYIFALAVLNIPRHISHKMFHTMYIYMCPHCNRNRTCTMRCQSSLHPRWNLVALYQCVLVTELPRYPHYFYCEGDLVRVCVRAWGDLSFSLYTCKLLQSL